MMNTTPHAFGVDDIDSRSRHTGAQIVFSRWVNLSEHHWETLGERRSKN
jgi:hypothetical protein